MIKLCAADVAERGVASIGVRSSGNLWVEEYVQGEAGGILLHLHIQRGKIVLRGSRAGWRSGCRNHPACVYV